MTESFWRIALLADGRSDRALLRVLTWVLTLQDPNVQLAEPEFRARDLGRAMLDEMRTTIRLFEPDILFVHRDAEAQDSEQRRREIPDIDGKLVRVVPVRMTEAWLLFDESAIRAAAGRPNGRCPLQLPSVAGLEDVPDPKALLERALLAAAEVGGRRLKKFRRDLPLIVRRVADFIPDFAPLRVLPAFARLMADCEHAMRRT